MLRQWNFVLKMNGLGDSLGVSLDWQIDIRFWSEIDQETRIRANRFGNKCEEDDEAKLKHFDEGNDPTMENWNDFQMPYYG